MLLEGEVSAQQTKERASFFFILDEVGSRHLDQ
jgi:hypothetical protein